MVQTIINPSTGRQVNVYGKLGQQILRNYQYQIAGGKNTRRSKSKLRSKQGKSNKWILSVKEARKQLGVKGFKAVKKGSPLYNRAKQIHTQMKR